MAFCDVDSKKIALGYYTHEESKVCVCASARVFTGIRVGNGKESALFAENSKAKSAHYTLQGCQAATNPVC